MTKSKRKGLEGLRVRDAEGRGKIKKIEKDRVLVGTAKQYYYVGNHNTGLKDRKSFGKSLVGDGGIRLATIEDKVLDNICKDVSEEMGESMLLVMLVLDNEFSFLKDVCFRGLKGINLPYIGKFGFGKGRDMYDKVVKTKEDSEGW